MSNIRQNLVLAFLYNALGIPVAAGFLYPFFGLLLSPIIAGAESARAALSRLVSLVSKPRVNLTRVHGVFASYADIGIMRLLLVRIPRSSG